MRTSKEPFSSLIQTQSHNDLALLNLQWGIYCSFPLWGFKGQRTSVRSNHPCQTKTQTLGSYERSYEFDTTYWPESKNKATKCLSWWNQLFQNTATAKSWAELTTASKDLLFVDTTTGWYETQIAENKDQTRHVWNHVSLLHFFYLSWDAEWCVCVAW